MLLHATKAIWSLPNLPDPLRYKNPSCDTHPQSARNHSSDHLSSFYEEKQSEKKNDVGIQICSSRWCLQKKACGWAQTLVFRYFYKKGFGGSPKNPMQRIACNIICIHVGGDSSTITTISGDLDWGRYILITKILSKTVPCWDTKEVSTSLHCTENQRIFQQISIQCSQMHRQKFRWCCQKQ